MKINTMHFAELLKELKKEFQEYNHWHTGLCSAANDIFSRHDFKFFVKYLKENTKNIKFIYFEGLKIHRKDVPRLESCYMWQPSNKQGRIRWLNKHIALLKDMPKQIIEL